MWRKSRTRTKKRMQMSRSISSFKGCICYAVVLWVSSAFSQRPNDKLNMGDPVKKNIWDLLAMCLMTLVIFTIAGLKHAHFGQVSAFWPEMP